MTGVILLVEIGWIVTNGGMCVQSSFLTSPENNVPTVVNGPSDEQYRGLNHFYAVKITYLLMCAWWLIMMVECTVDPIGPPGSW